MSSGGVFARGSAHCVSGKSRGRGLTDTGVGEERGVQEEGGSVESRSLDSAIYVFKD